MNTPGLNQKLSQISQLPNRRTSRAFQKLERNEKVWVLEHITIITNDGVSTVLNDLKRSKTKGAKK